MSNLFFDWPAKAAIDRFIKFDTVRAEDVNNAFDLVSAGLDKIPTPYNVNGGRAHFGTDTSTVGAYVVSCSAQITSYQRGLKVSFLASHTCAASQQINVGGLGLANITRQDGTAITAGAILGGQMVELMHDGSAFQLVGQTGTITYTTDPNAIQKQTATAFTTAGTSTAYTLAASPAIAAYTAGLSFFVTFHVASGASPTLNINGLGASVNLVKQLTDGTYANIAANDIPINHVARVSFLSTTLALVERFPAAGRLIGVQVISATGTYTPTPGTNSVVVQLVGGAGAGGGAIATAAGQQSAGSGGSCGGIAMSRLTAGFAGVTVTIGAAGASASGAVGGNGGTTSFGALFSATGGGGGQVGAALPNTTVGPVVPGTPGTATGGNLLNMNGQSGDIGFYSNVNAMGGAGASSPFGTGGASIVTGAGVAATGFGAGGGGASNAVSSAARSGGAATAGVAMIWEYT